MSVSVQFQPLNVRRWTQAFSIDFQWTAFFVRHGASQVYVLFKKLAIVYYQVFTIFLNGFKISDIDQPILALIFRFGVTVV